MDKTSIQLNHLAQLKSEYVAKITAHDNLIQETQTNIWQYEVEMEFLKKASSALINNDATLKKLNKLKKDLESYSQKLIEAQKNTWIEEKSMIEILDNLIANLQPIIEEDNGKTTSTYANW